MSCTAFRHILETQTCQLGSLSELQEALNTDPDVTKVFILGQQKVFLQLETRISCSLIKWVLTLHKVVLSFNTSLIRVFDNYYFRNINFICNCFKNDNFN
jgi:hypothetical protein